LAYDGLTDAFNNIAMGVCAEKTVSDFKMTR
jgi:acetyl-CoA C-acetyltransferase